jgi:hypothetical protein
MPKLPDDVRRELEELALDSIAATRAMLESGDTATRIEVINRVLPTVQKILAADGDDGGDENGPLVEARRLLADTWGPLAAKGKAS